MGGMLGQTRVAGHMDDDMVRRLMRAIEELADERTGDAVEEVLDGDLFLAYRYVRNRFAVAYPELYGVGVG